MAESAATSDPALAQKSPRKLYVFDFDKTILDRDSKFAILAVLREPLPEHIRSTYKQTHNWAQYYQRLFDYLSTEQNVTLENFKNSLKQLDFLPGMENLLQRISTVTRRDYPYSQFVVLSGCMNGFIQCVLGNLVPPVKPQRIIANISQLVVFEGKPRLMFRNYEEQQRCRKCPRCLCKGRALMRHFIEYGPFDKVYYAGDGSNDICPAMKLRACDVLFIRKDSKLETAVKNGRYASYVVKIRAEIHYFSNGGEIENFMEF